MALGNQRQNCVFVRRRGWRFVAAAALLYAILGVSTISPARAQAVATAPTDAHTTLTPAEAQRALDVLQDAGKRDELIEALRSIVKVSSVPATQATPAAVHPAAAADGFGAEALLQASSEIGELSGQFEQSLRTATKFPQLWRWLNQTATDPQRRSCCLASFGGRPLSPSLRSWRNALSSLCCVVLWRRWRRARRATLIKPGPSSLSAPTRQRPRTSAP